MKQVEKLDRILRYLYERRFDGKMYLLQNIVAEISLPVEGKNEIIMLGKRLKDDHVVDAIPLSLGRLHMKINTYGVDYCEERSYESASQPLVHTTINITNSQHVALNSNSAGATASSNGKGSILADRIMEEGQKDASLTPEDQRALKELLEEYKTCIAQGASPKVQVDALISRFGNLASIGSLILSLGQMAVGAA